MGVRRILVPGVGRDRRARREKTDGPAVRPYRGLILRQILLRRGGQPLSGGNAV